MPKAPHQLLAKLDDDVARRFKARLALDGTTYHDWLVTRIDAYLGKKRPTRTSTRKRGGAK